MYDCNLGLLRIGPFNYEPMRSVDLWLQQSDEFILQALSTTPDVEPPHTVMAVSLDRFSTTKSNIIILFFYIIDTSFFKICSRSSVSSCHSVQR